MNTALAYASGIHRAHNCLYDGQPYSVHLEHVWDIANQYAYLCQIPGEEQPHVFAAAACHDLIEDTTTSYNDLVKEIGVKAADIVYNVSNELGKNRQERALKTYPKIASCSLSTFVKLCDRLANIRYSSRSGSSMFEKYKKEHRQFKEQLEKQEHFKLWLEIEKELTRK